MTIPPFIVHLTGITDAMVKDAPLFSEVAGRWLDFIGDAVLVAHDAQFDMRFLNHELARVFPGQRMANSQLCTVTLSRRVIPGLLNYRLHTVAEHFDVPIYNRHRAAGDAAPRRNLIRRLAAWTSTACATRRSATLQITTRDKLTGWIKLHAGKERGEITGMTGWTGSKDLDSISEVISQIEISNFRYIYCFYPDKSCPCLNPLEV